MIRYKCFEKPPSAKIKNNGSYEKNVHTFFKNRKLCKKVILEIIRLAQKGNLLKSCTY